MGEDKPSKKLRAREKEDITDVETSQFVPKNTVPQKISQIQFGLLNGVDMVKMSEIQIYNRELYNHPSKEPTPNGPLDERLGTSNKTSKCKTCGESIENCPGHFGVLNLCLPVFHIGYMKAIHNSLRMICKSCSRILLDPQQRKDYLKRVRSKLLDANHKKEIQKKILKLCQLHQQCPWCGDWNGDVKKIGPLKLVHKKFKLKASDTSKEEWENEFKEAIVAYPEISSHLSRSGDDLHPSRVMDLFKKVPAEDCELLGMSHRLSRPEWMLLTHLLVPPCPIRPSVQMDQQGGSNEDDLTMKLQEILWINQVIKQDLTEKGTLVTQIMDRWNILQLQVALCINSEFPGIPSTMATKKPIRGLCQRLKGKQGRFRGNLSGKRVDFTARSVISPDPNLAIDEVGVPLDVATTLTYPEKVNRYNLDYMKHLVMNGPEIHPGAKFITYRDGSKRFLKYGDRSKIAESLRIGDVVERHLKDNDIVLFNRQPSLHRVSIMSHRAKVMPWKTLRFNECVCAPYNADFDGDEMNLHLPQTEEARAEALSLMNVKVNLAVPKSGELLISATQDFLTASYLITSKEIFFTHTEFFQIISGFFDPHERVEIPEPTILKPIALYTGKQIFSVLISQSKQSKIGVNLVLPLRNYSGSSKEDYTVPNDTIMVVHNGELLCGQLDKNALGGGKNTLFAHLLKYYDPQVSADRMSKVAKMCARYIGNHGFSIGISDVTPTPGLLVGKAKLVDDGYTECETFIDMYNKKQLEADAGCSVEETLEAKLNSHLSEIRDKAGKLCVDELTLEDKNNSPLVMSLCGSKGSKINVAQMVACVGQQTVSGQRVPNGFLNRTLPHFDFGSRYPDAKGFVSNSFFSGLTPTEFFFHTMGGREGLVDTAVKTAETGYMQRRLMKALEDLTVHYDGTVRGAKGMVVQFKYGDDGIEPTFTEKDSSPVDLLAQWNHCLHSNLKDHQPTPLSPTEVLCYMEDQLDSSEFKKCEPQHIEEVRSFFLSSSGDGIIDKLIDLRQRHGLDPKNTSQDSEKEKLVSQLMYISKDILDDFFKEVKSKYLRTQVEPGTAVGALCAQSIGEPCTQMTLKTFHFAGVASMNITLGVPRIREIINATKAISTPIMYVELNRDNVKEDAIIAKGRIEKTSLGDIAEYIKEVYSPSKCYLEIKIDFEAIYALRLKCTTESIKKSIVAHKKLKLKPEQIVISGKHQNKILIQPNEGPVSRGRDKHLKSNIYFSMQILKTLLPSVIVAGIPCISRCVIRENNKKYQLIVEGQDLLSVMAQGGVKYEDTKSNHVLEVFRSLGIEAARQAIINEIAYTMGQHGVGVDPRHLNLLADCMTSRGDVLGITRFGISKMSDSALMLASFEKTTDYLFDAGQRALSEPVSGVSECIIMGRPIPLGTGLFSLMRKSDSGCYGEKMKPKKLILAN